MSNGTSIAGFGGTIRKAAPGKAFGGSGHRFCVGTPKQIVVFPGRQSSQAMPTRAMLTTD
jgi:hypothetical protein